jgi:drug/metabolite transporter (DMT)-like permease
LLAALAHFSFAQAFQMADVTFLTPFGFSKFFLSALIGYLAFAELSTSLGLWLGAAIIGVSILLLSYEMPLKRKVAFSPL